MRHFTASSAMWISAGTANSLLTGCVLAPTGTKSEQAKLELASRPFESPPESRELPELPTPAD